MERLYNIIKKSFFSAVSVGFSIALNAQTTVILNPVKDNTLYESATGALSNGKGISMFVGRTNTGTNPDGLIRRALLKFDLTSIPLGATITAVTLTLRCDKASPGAQAVTLHSLNADWGEGASQAANTSDGDGVPAQANDATWLHKFATSTLWTTVGGEFNATASASASVTGNNTNYNWTSVQLVSDVQNWLNSPASNFGWLIKGNESVVHTAKSFSTREAVAANQPKLSITYIACSQPTITSFTAVPPSICEGMGAGLQVIGQLNNATSWRLYTDSCGGTLVESNTTGEFTVFPTTTTTYYVRAEGGCTSNTTCLQATVTVVAMEDPSFTYNASTYCQNGVDPTPIITGVTGGLFNHIPYNSGLSIDMNTGKIDLSASAKGNYFVRYRTQGMCSDSLIVPISIVSTISSNASVSICPDTQFNFGTQTLTTPGEYAETFVAQSGCDSVVTLTLSYKQIFNETVSKSICSDEQYSFGGTNLTESGQYQHVFTSQTVGCDSTVTLTLAIVEINPSIVVAPEGDELTAQPDGGSYQWLDCDNNNSAIDGETTKSYLPDESGAYAVAVTKDNCTETSDCQSITITGIEKNIGNLVSISPNPARAKAVIGFSKIQQRAHINIISSTGRAMYKNAFYNVERADIDTRELPQGVYLIKVLTEQGLAVVRFVVQ